MTQTPVLPHEHSTLTVAAAASLKAPRVRETRISTRCLSEEIDQSTISKPLPSRDTHSSNHPSVG
jgi:hypothetical protein